MGSRVAANLACNYRRGATGGLVSVPLSDLALLTSAHVDGGIKETVNGNYRLDLPDSAVAGGVDFTEVYLENAGGTALVQTGGAQIVDLASASFSPVLQHDIDPSFVFKLPRRRAGVLTTSYSVSIFVGETPRFAFDFSHVLDSKPRLITGMVVVGGAGLTIEDWHSAEAGVRDYLCMGQVLSASTAGTYTVRIAVEAFSGETVIAEGQVVVNPITA
ncbi:MAG: hypothetical protein ABGX16_07840 [Pirellulales bacterium]